MEENRKKSSKVFDLHLFETHREKGEAKYRIFAASIFVNIVCVWYYRWSHISSREEEGNDDVVSRIVWLGLFGAEFWFGLYWILTQSSRWRRIRRTTVRNTLAQRYGNNLPAVDIFVCTADPMLEPPIMVANTVLSVMAYDYPPEKLAVYLSDDGGSVLTCYAMLEASQFSKHWLPYCRKYSVEPRSPESYFKLRTQQYDDATTIQDKDLESIMKLYEAMKNRIETAMNLGRIPEEICQQHTGLFSQWSSSSSRNDHDTFLKILIDRRDLNAKDVEDCRLPTLVYLAREKKSNYHHNFKAGAMNALIRVSSKISNAQIILNVDCDMYSNSSQSIKDVLCFFLDEEKGHEFAYIQFPQTYENLSKNDLYAASFLVIKEVDFCGLDGFGGPMYIGSCCFHKREALSGNHFNKDKKIVLWSSEIDRKEENLSKLEERLKPLASCSYDLNTQWGKEMGLKYGCPVEDIITGLSMQCKGWKSVYFNPEREGFFGIMPTTLGQVLVQHKRWSEGHFQIFLSKYNLAWYGLGKIHPGLIMGYLVYSLWAANSLPVLYYSIVPTLYLLKGVSMFPQTSSPWFLAFAFVIIASYTQSFAEFLCSGGTVKGWWNDQRIWLYKRTSSYLFAFIDSVLKQVGFSESGFIISPKVSEEDVTQRYKQDIMEFGISSPMFTIISTIAMINLFSLVWIVKRMVLDVGIFTVYYKTMAIQIVLCGALVAINLPVYNALFIRKDKGKIPSSIAFKSVFWAFIACSYFIFSPY